jgi:6-phosphogluconolactonase
MKPRRVVLPDYRSIGVAAAEYILGAARESVRERGWFTLALSGGKTPSILYRTLASPPFSGRMPWDLTHVFWGDERCVPPDHPASNYRNAREILLARVPLPEEHIYRINGELGPEEAASAYGRTLAEVFSHDGGRRDSFPVFDCLILGIGSDGHTSSLFPGDPILLERERWVVPVEAPEGVSPKDRVCLTLPVINRAKRVIFLVSGAGKRNIITRLYSGYGSAENLPAARVNPAGECLMFTDVSV